MVPNEWESTARSTPAIVGPISRATLNVIALSGTAWARSSGGTTRPITDWRVGVSNAETTPNRSATATISQYCTMPSIATTPRNRAPSANSTCEIFKTTFLSNASAKVPANGPNTATGADPQKAMNESLAMSWVSYLTN